jgi:hypothetical protein
MVGKFDCRMPANSSMLQILSDGTQRQHLFSTEWSRAVQSKVQGSSLMESPLISSSGDVQDTSKSESIILKVTPFKHGTGGGRGANINNCYLGS